MSKTNKLHEEELKGLTENKESISLESLIVEGENLQIPITFKYPTKNGLTDVSAIIRPLTSSEWEEATNYSLKTKKDFALQIVKRGFLNIDGEEIPLELLRKMPAGVINELYTRIGDISGVKQDKKEQYELTKELMGF